VGVSHSKTFTGGITGTNSFTIQNDGGDDNLNFSTTAINNVGTITHTGTATTGVTTINAVIGSNVTGLTQSGPARLVLNAANTHGGTTTVNGGTLQLGNVNALQNTTLNTGASGSQQVTFTVGGTNIYNLGGLTGGDDLAIGGNTLSIGSNNQNTTYTGGISGVSGGLTKVGNGTLNLNGTNSYAGATAINGGTLAVNGSITSAGATMVSAGTLFVTGSLTSDVTVSDTATLGGGGTVGALSFGGGSFFDIFLAIGGNPLDATTISFAATGFGIDNLRSNGAAVDWGTVAGGTYTLINGTLDSTNLDHFGLANAYDLGGGRSAYFQDGSLQLTVIPEPRAALLGGLGLLALLRRRR
jgi:fibronectin-binding autotransporter adhesin